MSEEELKNVQIRFAAFSSAVAEMIASLEGQLKAVRQLLAERSIFPHEDYEKEFKTFAREGWPTLVNQVRERLQRLASEKEHKLHETHDRPPN